MSELKKNIFWLFIDKIADTFNGVFVAIFALFLGLFITKDVLTKKITALSDLLFTKNIIISPFYIFIGFTLFLGILLFFVFTIFKIKPKNKVIFEKNKEPEQQFEFKALYEQCIYTQSKTQIHYVRKIRLQVLKDNFKVFLFSFNSTNGGFEVVSLNKDHDLIRLGEVNFFVDYQLVMPNYLTKGAIQDIHLEFTYPNNTLVKPFLAKIVKYPIDILSLKVIFKKPIKIETIVQNHFEFYESNNIIDSKTVKTTNNSKEWIVNNPSINNYLEMSWKKSI